MPTEPADGRQRFLVEAYFYDTGQKLRLAQGETLLRQGEYNDRLYLITAGCLSARGTDEDGGDFELFRAEDGMFVGIYSFFSKERRSPLTIVAAADSRLCYIDRDQFDAFESDEISLFEEFMPSVVTELMLRHRRTLELSRDKERTFQKLLHQEKLASLGQMAAGVAHELNNAVAVLQRHSEWLATNLASSLDPDCGDNGLYHAGLERGAVFSTRQARQRGRDLERRFGLDKRRAERLGQTGLSDTQVEALAQAPPDAFDAGYRLWQIGQALRDMQRATHQATHVVKSVRTLGAPHADRGHQDLNETVREALSLMQSSLRRVETRLELAPLPPLKANRGELVQIWTNLIKNACESMEHSATVAPGLGVRSYHKGDTVIVEITDNGPGIPPDLLPQIFHPDVTTKVEGLSFGLGLGLSIVQRLVNEYGGSITARSADGETVFAVCLPLEQGYAKA
jgi:signal transduction histidine kinase